MQWAQEKWAVWRADAAIEHIARHEQRIGDIEREKRIREIEDEFSQRAGLSRPKSSKVVAIKYLQEASLETQRLRLAQMGQHVEQSREATLMAPLMRSVNSGLAVAGDHTQTAKKLKTSIEQQTKGQKDIDGALDDALGSAQSEEELGVLGVIERAAVDDELGRVDDELNRAQPEALSRSWVQRG